MGSLIFLVLLLFVMYFILIRPQQRQMKEQAARIRSLEPGMVIVTSSGIHGAVAEIITEDDEDDDEADADDLASADDDA